MKMHSPATSDLDHQTIASRIDYRGMDEDRIHDILNGYHDVPTDPEPVRLRLTKAERAYIWHSIASGDLVRARRDGDHDAIARAEKAEAWAQSIYVYESVRESLGDLAGGRCLVYVDNEVNQGRYRVIDSVGTIVARVTDRDDFDTIRRLVDAYDAGIEAGRADAKAAIRSAIGL